MKRFWLFALLVAGSFAVLAAPTFGKAAEGTDDSSETSMEDINSGLGSLSSRVGEVEKTLGLKFFGDVRVRMDWRSQAQGDITTLDSTGTILVSGGTINDQLRPRYRARLGVTKTVGDVTGTLRFATGASNNPNSENQTFDAGFQNPTINIDTASLVWVPGFLKGHLKLAAGKMANPLLASPISWDPDIMPEGFLVEASNAQTSTKLRATYFYINNNNGGAALGLGTPVSLYLTGSNIDQYIANIQLEQLLQIDKDTSVNAMVGFEYVPYVSALAGGTVNSPPSGTLNGVLNNNLVGADGMIWNYGKFIPDIQILEGMLVINHKIGDIPVKWTLHVIDNLDSFNIPLNANVLALANVALLPPYAALPASGAYSTFTNQYGFYAGVNINQVKVKGDIAGLLAAGYLEPNAQLGFLTDDDPGNNNREYLKANITYGLEDNVLLSITSFAVDHVYYAYLGAPTNKLAGTSQNAEFVTFFDAMASF